MKDALIIFVAVIAAIVVATAMVSQNNIFPNTDITFKNLGTVKINCVNIGDGRTICTDAYKLSVGQTIDIPFSYTFRPVFSKVVDDSYWFGAATSEFVNYESGRFIDADIYDSAGTTKLAHVNDFFSQQRFVEKNAEIGSVHNYILRVKGITPSQVISGDKFVIGGEKTVLSNIGFYVNYLNATGVGNIKEQGIGFGTISFIVN